MLLRSLRVYNEPLARATQYDIERGVVYRSRARFRGGSWYVALTSWSDRYSVLADACVATEAESAIVARSIKDICLLAKGGET